MCGNLTVERAYIMTIEQYLSKHLPPANSWSDTEQTLTTSVMVLQISKAIGSAVDWAELIGLLEKKGYVNEVHGGETYWLIAVA